MNVVLLSGGTGKRLWPLSNDIRSKQFIKIFKNNEGEYESMIQRMYRKLKAMDENCNVTIAAPKIQVSALNNQLGSQIRLSLEPCSKGTFHAISLALAKLYYEDKVDASEVIVVCPSDPQVEDDYFQALKALEQMVEDNPNGICLMGIKPTYPSAKYGYIIPDKESAFVADAGSYNVSGVSCFVEKPSEEKAKALLEGGAMWNAGVFAFTLGYMIERIHAIIDFTDYVDLYAKYETLSQSGFDKTIVECTKYLKVLHFMGNWKDLGTWNTLTEAMESDAVGEAIFNETCQNVHVINELNMPVLCMGLSDVVVSASPDGILVSDKNQSSYIKPFVDEIDNQIMYAEKSWGNFRVLDIEEKSMTIKVTLNPGHSMNYHAHEHRDEVWTIIAGTGRTIVDGMEQHVRAGDVITMAAGCRHTIIADSELQVIEVQLGTDISVHDKIKYELEI